MLQLKINRYIVSIALSLISIAITIIINLKIANAYLESDGKTKALFGLIEFLQFGYQYYVVTLGILSLIISVTENYRSNKTITMGLLSTLAIVIVFVRLWRLFV